MKNICIIILLIKLTTNVEAQSKYTMQFYDKVARNSSTSFLHANKINSSHHTTAACLYDSIIEYTNWNSTLNNWSGKNTLVYNNYGNQISFVQQVWNVADNKWMNYALVTTNYNSNNNVALHLDETWDTLAKLWLNSSQTIYTYASNNELTSYTSQYRKGSVWVNYQRDTDTYSSNGNLISDLQEQWDTTTSIWQNDYITTYNYNSNNDILGIATQRWGGNAWYNNDSTAIAYNLNKNVADEKYFYWSGTSWLNNSLITYNYNSYNNVTATLSQRWSSNVWVNSDSVTYMYNSNQVDTAFKDWVWNDSVWVNNGPQGIADLCNNTCYAGATDKNWPAYYIFVLPQWQGYGTNDSVLFYGCSVEGIPAVNNTSYGINIYPNPANSILNIVVTQNISTKAEIRIIELTGKEILSMNVSVNDKEAIPINLNGLARGMYFVEITTDKGTQTSKFIKQ